MCNILITGASGFLGSNLYSTLIKSTHNLTTLGISETDQLYCDLSTSIPIIKTYFDYVIHLAGKAHVKPKNSKDNSDFFMVNYEGTKNLLKGLDEFGKLPKSIVFVSTVAVYGLEFGTNITEEYPLLGTSPYALSKIQAEEYLNYWCSKRNVTLGILRPSLIAGKNPPGNLGDMIKGIKSGRYLRIEKGLTKKSILMVDDISNIITKLFQVGGVYNICDDYHPSFSELEDLIAHQLGKKSPFSIPYWIAKCLALVGDLVGEKFPITSIKLNKIVKPLTFSNNKAKKALYWQPLDVLSNFKIE